MMVTDDDTHTRLSCLHAGPRLLVSSSALPAPARDIAPRIRATRHDACCRLPRMDGRMDGWMDGTCYLHRRRYCWMDGMTSLWTYDDAPVTATPSPLHPHTLAIVFCAVVRCRLCVLTASRAHDRTSRTTPTATSFTNLAKSWRIDVREYQT